MRKLITFGLIALVSLPVGADIYEQIGACKKTEDAAKQLECFKALPDKEKADGISSNEFKWSYGLTPDKMSDTPYQFATIVSTSNIELDFPYEGKHYATLALREHGGDKKIMIALQKAQFTCDIPSCDIDLRFDENSTQTRRAKYPDGGNTSTLFIEEDYPSFIEKLSKAKTLKISVPIYQKGDKIFEFVIDGFDAEKLKQAK